MFATMRQRYLNGRRRGGDLEGECCCGSGKPAADGNRAEVARDGATSRVGVASNLWLASSLGQAARNALQTRAN